MAETTESGESIEELKKLFENHSTTSDEDPIVWLTLVRDKLYSMFCSPMKEDYTYEAFKWVANLCISTSDFSWISPKGEWSKHECKIFSCISLLSMAELQILMPAIQRRLIYGDEPEVEDGKVLAKSANKEDYDRFGNHLIIIESVIKALVKGQQSDDNEQDTNDELSLADSMISTDLFSILDKLKETMTIICEYLESIHRNWERLNNTEVDTEIAYSSKGAIRIMCVWLSEDPQSFQLQCKGYLIDLLIKNLLLTEEANNKDLLILALHSVCTYDEEMIDVLRCNFKHKEALELYLKHVDKEQSKYTIDKRKQKFFKLRCGLIKDLMREY